MRGIRAVRCSNDEPRQRKRWKLLHCRGERTFNIFQTLSRVDSAKKRQVEKKDSSRTAPFWPPNTAALLASAGGSAALAGRFVMYWRERLQGGVWPDTSSTGRGITGQCVDDLASHAISSIEISATLCGPSSYKLFGRTFDWSRFSIKIIDFTTFSLTARPMKSALL